MLPDAAVYPARTATASATASFDPWDAPYFGGAVYLDYSPALPDRPIQSAAADTGTGVPVSANLQPELALVHAKTEPTTSDSARPRKRGWWSRLFG